MAPSAGLRALLAAAFIAATFLTIGRDARADEADEADDAGADAASDASPPEIGPSQWTSIRVHGDAGSSVWIVVGASGTCGEVVSGAWDAEAGADASGGPDLTSAKAIALDTNPDALIATLAEWGLPMTDDLARAIDLDAGAASGACFVAVRELGENADNDDGGGGGGGGSPAAAAVEGCGSAADSTDGCGSDTGSDGDDGGGCSGGDDGGGDDCSGGGDPDCHMAYDGGRGGHGRRRSPTSRALLALAGIALLARRRSPRGGERSA